MQVKYFIMKTVDGNVVRITERKLTKRDRFGRFVGNRCGGYCRWYGKCLFTDKTW